MKEEENDDKTFLGFWIYLMSDLLMFAGLFASFTVLRTSTYGGVTEKQIFDLPFVLIETMVLLISSFTCGLAVLFAKAGDIRKFAIFIGTTFLLGLTFISMELYEFIHLFQEGHTFQKSAFLSSYFALVGTHGLHITAGLLWMVMLFVYFKKKGFTKSGLRKLTLMSFFWHFLDIVWIFIFTIVYLMGVVL